jgi:hypothetical protein
MVLGRRGMRQVQYVEGGSLSLISKRKDKCKVFYSRRHFDKAMGVECDLEPEYYTMTEAMARYNMTRDQLLHYIRTHNIPRTYEGRYVRIGRKALDALFAPPKIS